MTRSRTPSQAPRVVDVDVTEEMQGSFLEYAYSVIYSRALPDARDGLKPVQRRILYQMAEMGLRPDRGHVKSARVVGEVMGKLHPHGDGAIYDALVRMAQAFTLRLPMVDGHGNFGSLDDGPAAMRYTECRMAAPALEMTRSLDENVVDFVSNYDGRETEPTVLPAAIPNLLVNGASGIAVGMATNMPPHNLGETVAAARHLLSHPDAKLTDLMRMIPGPDLPTGGIVVGLDGIRQAYATGKGSFRMRATTRVEQVSARGKGIVVTSLPYSVGPERVIERIKDLVIQKKLTGISGLADLTDAEHGLRLVVQTKAGFNPEAVLAQLFRLTPLEEQFSINNVALVDGRPRQVGLIELLQVFLDHRIDVVRRRSSHRRARARERLHLVEGLLVAILDIDEVIAIIRGSDDTAQARHRLMAAFELSDEQTTYILDMPLRRLTKFSRLELETEASDLRGRIEELDAVLGDEKRLRALVAAELTAVADKHANPRRTVLLESEGGVAEPEAPLEVADAPCWVLLSNTGTLARTSGAEPPGRDGPRASHDCIVSAARASTRGHVGLVTSDGFVHRLPVIELPGLPATDGAPTLAGGVPLGALLDLSGSSRPVGLVSLSDESLGLALATRSGLIKRVAPNGPASKDLWDVIRLSDGDDVVGVADVGSDSDELVFVSTSGQLLRFPAQSVRTQGRSAAGMAGIKLGPGDQVVFFGVIPAGQDPVVASVSGTSTVLAGTSPGRAKVTPMDAYPSKGRGTGGVRCHKFRSDEDTLLKAWVGLGPVRAATASGAPIEMPDIDPRRDGSGTLLDEAVADIGGSVS
ncbi:MAG: DNA topoisomerase (ATP-hydrolyzing) [Candidatus Nanopelagicales bacterium]|nr:DNA topoisomerase (ATP-hydrolyzing) [Candidatus Nanopelagicales bacterium]MDZ4250209.1 DNA topoisomerase (ATP-hydrolyzing) [Candidatus Nanopelagicales bacterium]